MSMKPNDFIMNSDYLSIAQIGKYNFELTIQSTTIAGNDQIVSEVEFGAISQKGAIDQIMICVNNGEFRIGNRYAYTINTNVGIILYVYRKNQSTIAVTYSINNGNSSSVVVPTTKFKIKIISFKPPTMF